VIEVTAISGTFLFVVDNKKNKTRRVNKTSNSQIDFFAIIG
jgi:hypothetical protein